MQLFEDVLKAVKQRCVAAGLLRAGEQLDSTVHGAERREGGEDENGEDFYFNGWEPKESVKKKQEEERIAIAPYQCYGSGDYRMSRHDVQASTDRPAKVFATTTTFSSLTPFNKTRYTTIRFQCVECNDAAAARAQRAAAREYECAKAEQLSYEEDVRRAKEATKKRKAEEKKEQEKRLKRTVEFGEPALVDFLSKVVRLNQSQLKSLCVANKLLRSGTKRQLTELLLSCRMYGHSGSCPDCRTSQMALIFANPNICEPTHVECKYVYPRNRKRCRFGKKPIEEDRTRLLPQKLRDDDMGTLRSVGIEVGAAAAGRGDA